MNLSDFNYEYPKGLVAQRPLKERDASRMMVVLRGERRFIHSRVSDLTMWLKKGDLVIMNDSMVVSARLFGRRANGEEIELLVVEPSSKGEDTWRCLLKRAKRIRKGEKFFFGMQATATAGERDDAFLLVRFKDNGLKLAMKHRGAPPLPPYIEREGFEAYTAEDRERYQTIFADREGSAAAPTAGLHFSEALMGKFSDSGIETEKITLHVGIDTFTPVRTEDPLSHRMHGERVEIYMRTAKAVARAKSEGRRVVAIGTTTTRALESSCLRDNDCEGVEGCVSWSGGNLAYGKWTTDLFITPGFRFKVVDAMLTNFHLPKSTLLMLVSAFSDREFILSCYEEAIREKYRLFSYGDCMLIL